MDYLPPPEEQHALLAELATLIARRGHATFVAAPLLEPRVEHFPDVWQPDATGVSRLARRLLAYAELGQLDVEVELFESGAQIDEIDAQGRATAWSHQGAAAWFEDIVKGVCRFGADARGLAAPDSLAGVMAHEVAHAYRRRHRLEASDGEAEERLTDLTTVYLGFGVLTTNASYRYRQSGEIKGNSASLQWSHERRGYLSPQAMSFLLAAQVVARGMSSAERRRLAGMLETNQAAYFKAACDALGKSDVVTRLALPLRGTWPAPRAARPEPLVDRPQLVVVRDDEVLAALQDEEPAAPLAGIAIFRVSHHTGGRRLDGFGFLGLVAGMFGLIGHISPWGILVGMFVGAVYGWWSGWRARRDRCSEPECQQVLAEGLVVCPGCGGTIRGRLASANERLAAREDLEAAERA
jgi:hypothetical protein